MTKDFLKLMKNKLKNSPNYQESLSIDIILVSQQQTTVHPWVLGQNNK